jgi:hypothetical protein
VIWHWYGSAFQSRLACDGRWPRSDNQRRRLCFADWFSLRPKSGSIIWNKRESESDKLFCRMRIKPSEVLEPLEWGKQYDDAAAVAGRGGDGVTATQELLVSMCFFARLAVIQPPCCLECAYHHQTRHNETCTGWVVWRKDAKQLAHPDTLGSNIVMVPCWIAQRLTASGHMATTIGGWTWDTVTKQFRRAS